MHNALQCIYFPCPNQKLKATPGLSWVEVRENLIEVQMGVPSPFSMNLDWKTDAWTWTRSSGRSRGTSGETCILIYFSQAYIEVLFPSVPSLVQQEDQKKSVKYRINPPCRDMQARSRHRDGGSLSSVESIFVFGCFFIDGLFVAFCWRFRVFLQIDLLLANFVFNSLLCSRSSSWIRRLDKDLRGEKILHADGPSPLQFAALCCSRASPWARGHDGALFIEETKKTDELTVYIGAASPRQGPFCSSMIICWLKPSWNNQISIKWTPLENLKRAWLGMTVNPKVSLVGVSVWAGPWPWPQGLTWNGNLGAVVSSVSSVSRISIS